MAALEGLVDDLNAQSAEIGLMSKGVTVEPSNTNSMMGVAATIAVGAGVGLVGLVALGATIKAFKKERVVRDNEESLL